MPNLDVSRAPKSNADLYLHYDGENSTFYFASESWDFLKEYLQEEPDLFAAFGFDETGDIIINGRKAGLALYSEGSVLSENFKDRELSYVAEAFTDLVGGRKSKKQITGMENIIVTQNLTYYTDEFEIKAQQRLIYEYDTRSLCLDVLLRSNTPFRQVTMALTTPDKLLNYRMSMIPSSPTHLKTYIYVFNN